MSIHPPRLRNQYEDDQVLRSYLRRVLPSQVLTEIEPSLFALGRLSGAELYEFQVADRLNEPRLVQWDAWGNRLDHIEVTQVWQVARRLAAEFGIVATAYEQKHGSLSRIHQCALAYLFTPSTDIYSCPLAMTDGAARTLLGSGNQALIDRAVPHLISRSPDEFWTAGQWMTEITGGSDVGLSQTIARRKPESQEWELYGDKWFASAINSEVALTLARPEGNPPGGKGLALFYLELRDEQGRLRNIQINRLKDKLGTRKVPTAELTLSGTPAYLVEGETDGVRNIAPLLNITRLWNGISSVALMRRGLALANDYASRRVAFGGPLSEKPLHHETLASLEAEFEGAFHLAFFVAELTGKSETREIDEQQALLLRLLTPIMKLLTAKQAVSVASEVLEAFGGAGYVEDTGLPALLRDSQVLPIWEGTTNVLSLDALRAMGISGKEEMSSFQIPAFEAFKSEVARCLATANDDRLNDPVRIAQTALERAEDGLRAATNNDQLKSGARRFAMALGRIIELALLVKHAAWSKDEQNDERPLRSALRLAQNMGSLIL
jgi:alkylation response protein AidB-like acyl-CoA dehydrogenase